ncbi:MAG: hypothetical protein MHMPM18_000125 [Marteilia pararefringens]
MSENTCSEASVDRSSAPTDAPNSTKYNLEQRKQNVDAEECIRIIKEYRDEIIKYRDLNDTKCVCLNLIKHQLILTVLTLQISLMVLPVCFYLFLYRGEKLNYDEFCYLYYRKFKNKSIMATKQYYKSLKISRNKPFLEPYERFIYCLLLCLVSMLFIGIVVIMTVYAYFTVDRNIEIERVSALLVAQNKDRSKTKYFPIYSPMNPENSKITLYQPDPKLLADHHLLELRLSVTIHRYKRQGTMNIVRPVLLRMSKNKGADGTDTGRIYCFFLPSVWNLSFFNLQNEKQTVYCSDAEKHEISLQTTVYKFRIYLLGTTYVFSLLAASKIVYFFFSLSMPITEYVRSLEQSINMELHERVPEIETVLIEKISELLKIRSAEPGKKIELAKLFGALVTLNRCLTLKMNIMEQLEL